MPIIDPELLAFVDEVRAANAATTALMLESTKTFDPGGDFVAQLRSMMEPGGVFGQDLVDEAQERTVPGPSGDIPVRVFVPPTVDAVYLSIHGGAFMMGSRRSSDQTNWRIAQQCNVAVVSPEYRMAPEYRYPAGHDDCEMFDSYMQRSVDAGGSQSDARAYRKNYSNCPAPAGN